MTAKVTVFASFTPLESSRDVFFELVGMMIENSRRERGCERYDLYEDDHGGVHLFEVYSDEVGLREHRETDHYKEYRARVADLLSEDIRVVVLRGVDVEP